MRVWLLDANVLIAVVWPEHIGHEAASRWFRDHGSKGWATCAFTEAAFVRILSNPAFDPNALPLGAAMELLERNRKHPKHVFWPMDMRLQ